MTTATKTYKTESAAKAAITRQKLEDHHVKQEGQRFIIVSAPLSKEKSPTEKQFTEKQTLPVIQFASEQEMRDWLNFKDQQKAKQQVEEKKALIKDKCHRHPDITVEPGDNCPQCIKNIRVDEERRRQRNFVPPCPQCGNKEHQRNGGTIARARKQGSFICGNCQITFNMKAESAQWGKGDQFHH